ncbi:MAG: serine/threonine-protein kinase [Candidatus Limnocylindria bacterium]
MDAGDRVRSGELLTPRARYKIQAVLGRGGMGVVYKAIQETEHIRRTVALKLLASDLSQDHTFRLRFMRESRLAAELNHPNIIPIYDADEAGGQLFLAMPLIEGDDLATVLNREGPLPPERTLNIIRQVGSALDKAHLGGLIHRDVKPGNILMASAEESEGTEHVYLCDFGLTKRMTSQSGLTKTGHFLGTLEYVAPEQIEGHSITGAVDIYALGCVMFECLTGRPPFERESDLALLHAHMTADPPSVLDYQPRLPSGIDTVIARAMAKDPGLRQASCRELVQDARAALAAPPAPPPHPDPDPRGGDERKSVRQTTAWRPALIALAVLVAILLLLGIGFLAVFLAGDQIDGLLSAAYSPAAVALATPRYTRLGQTTQIGT